MIVIIFAGYFWSFFLFLLKFYCACKLFNEEQALLNFLTDLKCCLTQTGFNLYTFTPFLCFYFVSTVFFIDFPFTLLAYLTSVVFPRKRPVFKKKNVHTYVYMIFFGCSNRLFEKRFKPWSILFLYLKTILSSLSIFNPDWANNRLTILFGGL